MNRRAEGSLWAIDSMPSYIIFILFVGLSATLFFIFTQFYSIDQYRVSDEIKSTIITERFFAVCFGDIIDEKKFTTENLNKCYNVNKESTTPAYRLTLFGTSITTANWKDTFPDAAKVYDIQMIKNNAPIHATMTVEVQHE